MPGRVVIMTRLAGMWFFKLHCNPMWVFKLTNGGALRNSVLYATLNAESCVLKVSESLVPAAPVLACRDSPLARVASLVAKMMLLLPALALLCCHLAAYAAAAAHASSRVPHVLFVSVPAYRNADPLL